MQSASNDARHGLALAINDVSDLIVHYLAQLGIEYVFGVPGGAIEPIYNALARSERAGGPRAVVARHESGAAFMADGYARETGKPGVCIATSGPGATNMITGVATALDNNVPLIAITGQPPLPSFGRRALQDSACTGINVPGMFAHCARYNTLISHPGQADAKIVSALLNACHSRQPSHISIPVDIQRSAVQVTPLHTLAQQARRPALLDLGAADTLVTRLRRAQRKVFFIGAGCSDIIGPLIELAHRVSADLISTPDAKGLINPMHPRYHGVFGFAGHESAVNLLASEPDLVVAFGVGISEWTSAGWSERLLNTRLIHVDDQSEHLLGSPMAGHHVFSHLPSLMQHLLGQFDIEPASSAPTLARIGGNLARPADPPASPVAPVPPSALMRFLSRQCPPQARVVADAGNSTAWAVNRLEIADRRGLRRSQPQGGGQNVRQGNRNWLQVLMNFAPMGWAIGAAVGLAMADRRRPVICLTGDGSYLMNGQEIGVALAEELSVAYVILNDSSLGMVRHGQRLAQAESIGHKLPSTNFAAMARAMGVRAYNIDTYAELLEFNLADALAKPGPCLIDVRIDPEEVPPITMRLAALGTAK
ncbi:thiamine pyrophosphate-binding protein [Uliginosibacterium sp. H1]|uniref:thiamine pyrophosphate-binding protein n=1 Tax=Uliginosibacterium sp. H1 TaxID=3114757 RepID=UPI002E184D39|nr:thiamine pyrophosphate-binding protein [Uliginosibacterium sp. H1]